MVNEPIESPVSGQLALGERPQILTLLTSIFVIAGCGLVYELLMATVSAYLLGNSVTQFSLAIGVFIGAMGLGSHLSQYIQTNLLRWFILLEIILGILGGGAVTLLFWAYGSGPLYPVILYGLLISIGTVTGIELPLLTRILRDYGELREVIAQALSFDYIGAFIGSILFPLILLPTFGLARTGLVIGLLNLGVALWNLKVFWSRITQPRSLVLVATSAGLILVSGFIYSIQIMGFLEQRLYEDRVIYTAQTPYQRIVLTRWREDVRLFLDGNLQFSAQDEYRYHESLVHPVMSLAPTKENILILGGGDGLALREVLLYKSVKTITLVDLDPKMTELGQQHPALVELNKQALLNSKVNIVNQDAYKFLEESTGLYDVILIDLPDPNGEALAKLYSRSFYTLIKRHLAASGLMVMQATSPLMAREAYWCIVETLEATGFNTLPYHAYVPSFGDWGFVIAGDYTLPTRKIELTVPTRFLNSAMFQEMKTFSKDNDRVEVKISTLDRPRILEYYLSGWRRMGE